MKKTLLLFVLLSSISLSLRAQVVRYAGGDISLLPQYEKFNTPYKDASGNKIDDVLLWFINECHWNTFRVRIFVNPTDPNKEGVIQDLPYVKALGKRIKDAGAYFMLDFHYSDTWVDATHIQAPAVWKGLSDELMADSLGQYTARVLDELNAIGATPDLVQVGNEIMYGLCGIKVAPYERESNNWIGYTGLLKAGCNAVREHCPEAKIIIHTDRPTNSQYNKYFYQKLIDMGVDYDVIGLSYYPFWHGYLTEEQVVNKSDKNNLFKAVNQLAIDFPTKEVQIVETAYNFQYWPTSGVNYNTQDVWPCSVKGQCNFVRDLVCMMDVATNVTGINYWFPEENGNGGPTWNANTIVINSWLSRGLWDSSSHALNKVSSTEHAADWLGKYVKKVTALDKAENSAPVTKCLMDNQLVIVRGDKKFSVMGTLL